MKATISSIVTKISSFFAAEMENPFAVEEIWELLASAQQEHSFAIKEMKALLVRIEEKTEDSLSLY